MKKLLIIATIITFAFTSCKKERVCVCTTTTTGGGSVSASTTIKDTKKNAQEACKNQNSTSSILGFTTTVDCKLE